MRRSPQEHQQLTTTLEVPPLTSSAQYAKLFPQPDSNIQPPEDTTIDYDIDGIIKFHLEPFEDMIQTKKEIGEIKNERGKSIKIFRQTVFRPDHSVYERICIE